MFAAPKSRKSTKRIKMEIDEKIQIPSGMSLELASMLSLATPIDLSRHCDSVETRKTPSPYSSGFGDISPRLINDSPTSNPSEPNLMIDSLSQRSISPSQYYQAAEYAHNNIKFEPMPTDQPFGSQMMTMTDAVQMEIRKKIMNLSSISLPQLETVKKSMSLTGTLQADRPFKMYGESPFLSEMVVDESYTEFRNQTLDSIRKRNGGQLIVSNPKMRRKFHQENPVMENGAPNQDGREQGVNNDSDPAKMVKDNGYYERRRKNNEAARKSRDRRRQKEDELAIRTTFLEHENMLLKIQLNTVKKQLNDVLALRNFA